MFISRIKPGSDEKTVSKGKLLQMLTTRSVKNEEQAVLLLYAEIYTPIQQTIIKLGSRVPGIAVV